MVQFGMGTKIKQSCLPPGLHPALVAVLRHLCTALYVSSPPCRQLQFLTLQLGT